MKAVILAAGKSTRTYPLTLNKPKALLKIANRTIIEHNLTQLQGLVDEAVIVIGRNGALIKESLGSRFRKIRLNYVRQKNDSGTAHAILAAEKMIPDRFMVLMADDLYGRKDLQRCIRHDLCILTKTVPDVSGFGAVKVKSGALAGIQEKPGTVSAGLANVGFYVLDKSIFSLIKKLKKSRRGEYEITDAISVLSKKKRMSVEKAGFWFPVTYPWSLLDANEAILKNVSGKSEGKAEKGATLKGKVIVGKGTLIRSGAYVEGPVIIGKNCDVGPNCYIRPYTSIGDNCRIGNSVEIKNSIIMDDARVGHLSYVGDSIIGMNVNLGAGFIVANLRHDHSEIKSMVKNKLIGTGRKKFGTAIGDGAKTGIRTSVYPGRKIWPGKTTLPGEIVKEDVE